MIIERLHTNKPFDLYDPDAERIEVDDSDIDGMLDEDPDLFGGVAGQGRWISLMPRKPL